MVALMMLSTLRDLVEARAVPEITIIGEDGDWAVSVRHAEGDRLLAGKNGEPRVFARLDTVARQLLEIGLESFQVRHVRPSEARPRVKRPDRSAAMKVANEYAAWLKLEVANTRKAIAQGDMRVIDEAEMESRWASKRAEREQRRRNAGG